MSLVYTSKSELYSYMSIYNDFKTHDMAGIVKNPGEMTQNCYIFSLDKKEKTFPPAILATLDDPEIVIDEDQNDLLWILIIGTNNKNSFQTVHKEHKCDSCDKTFSQIVNLNI